MIHRKIEVDPTPDELAQEFWNLNSDEQAVFFNHLFLRAGSRHSLEMQMLHVVKSQSSTYVAIDTMRIIGSVCEVKND